MESFLHVQLAENQSSTSSCSVTGSAKLSDESTSESTLDEPCNNKREKMEEEKLKVLKEIKDDKSAFFNRFFDYLEKKKP